MHLRLCFFFFILNQTCFGQADILASASWKTSYDSAQYYWNNNTEKSINLLTKAERVAFNDLGIYDENYLTILNDLGVAYSQIKNFRKAEEYLSRNISIRHELSDEENSQTLKATCNLATVYLKSGEDVRAKQLYKEVLFQAEQMNLGEVYMTASENLSNVFEAQEYYDSALFILGKALNAHFVNPQIQTEYKLRFLESKMLRKMKRFPEASRKLEVLKKSLYATSIDLTALNHAIQVEQSLLNLETGLYNKAEKDLLELYRNLKNQSKQDEGLLTELTNALAYTYEKLGIYDKASFYYQESLKRCLKNYGYNSLSCAIMQNNMAGILLKQGNTTQAIAQYEEFIASYKKLSKENTSVYRTAMNNLATAYREMGKYDVALNLYTTLYDNLKQQNLLESEFASTVLNNLGVIYMLQGDFAQAIQHFERVMELKEKYYGATSPVILDVLENLATTYWVSGNTKESLPLFKRSLEITEREIRYIFPNLTETEQVQFYQRKKQSFERFNSLAIQHIDEVPALAVEMSNNQLLLKSIVFFTTRKRNEKIYGNTKLTGLTDRIDVVRKQLGHLYQLPSEEIQNLKLSTAHLESEIDSLEKIIRHALAEDGRDQSYYLWHDVQQSLKADEALVDLIRFRKYDVFKTSPTTSAQTVNTGFTDSVYYVALITTAETRLTPRVVILRNGYNLEHRNHRYYVNVLAVDMEDEVSYQAYWEKIDRELKAKKKIFLSPDGIYHQINLNTLRDHNQTYILEKYDVHSLLNPTQIVNRQSFPDINFSTSVLMGDPVFTQKFNGYSYDPLPGSNAEVKGITEALGLSNNASLLRHAASEVNLRKIQSPSLLHIATHGFFSSSIVQLNEHVKNDFMFHSGIVLTGDQSSKDLERDGIVTAYDVASLDLSGTQLVVLSACETGLGKIEHSEGVFGLQRAFLQAGAKAISISLWKVEDQMTKELMVLFYRHLHVLKNPQQALKQAQLDLMKRGTTPSQWGAFVMVNSY